MHFNKTLFLWQLRRVGWINLIAMPIALTYVLARPEPFIYRWLGWTLLFTLVHSILITWQLGQTRSRSFGFLYTQGYSRDAIWTNTMLATAASVLIVWLPVSLAIWTGLRCGIQDLTQNYHYPVMSSLDQSYPFLPLLIYFVFLTTFHYTWIRTSQPTRGSISGIFLAVAVVILMFSLWNSLRIHSLPDIGFWLILAGLLIASLALLIGGRRLHRRLEVIS